MCCLCREHAAEEDRMICEKSGFTNMRAVPVKNRIFNESLALRTMIQEGEEYSSVRR